MEERRKVDSKGLLKADTVNIDREETNLTLRPLRVITLLLTLEGHDRGIVLYVAESHFLETSKLRPGSLAKIAAVVAERINREL